MATPETLLFVANLKISSKVAIPPEIITGIWTDDEAASANAKSGPSKDPSWSIELTNASPIPRSSARFSHSITSRPDESLP